MEFDWNDILSNMLGFSLIAVVMKVSDLMLKRRGVSMQELDTIVERISGENKRLEEKILTSEERLKEVVESEADCKRIRIELEDEIKQLREWKGWLDENVLRFHKNRLEGEQGNDN